MSIATSTELFKDRSASTRSNYGATEVPVIISPGGTDHEELIGEDLLATDNEEDDDSPTISNMNFSGTNIEAKFRCWGRSTVGSLLNFRGNHPVGHVARVALVMFVAICMCTLVLVLAPNRYGIGRNRTAGEPVIIPFATVDRASYSEAASSIVDPELFHPDLLHNSTTTHRRLKKENDDGDAPVHLFLVEPFPTGAFWTNLVLKTSTDSSLSYPVVAYPFAYKWSDSMLQASYPAHHRRTDKISIRDLFVPDMTLSAKEQVANRYVMKFDPLSVTLRFQTISGGHWESYLVQGSPYITVKYEESTPMLRALSTFKDCECPFDSKGEYNDGIAVDTDDSDLGCSSTGCEKLRKLKWGVCSSSAMQKTNGNTFEGKALKGVQFMIKTQEGLTWIVFASEPITLLFDSARKTTIQSTDKFSGVIRAALIPPSSGDDNLGRSPFSESTGLRRLVYHSDIYPVGGRVSWEFQTKATSSSFLLKSNATVGGALAGSNGGPPNSRRIATIHFSFDTKQMTANTKTTPKASQEELLMLSLPHHAESLRSDVLLQLNEFDLVYRSIKGRMVPVLGDTWSYEEPLVSAGFDDADVMSHEKYAEEVDPEVRRRIMENLKKDLSIVLPTFDENVYGFGKQVARLAQLTHISNLMAPMAKAGPYQNHTDVLCKTTVNAVQSLHSFLSGFLSGGVTDQLLYDGNFGGIITKAGLLNSDADFGNGWYNDHHFHYGYILYACAVLGKMNSTFLSEYGPFVDALLFDVAGSSEGLFPFGNGKSQESSSEAVNCYYGAYLWSMIRFGTESESGLDIADFAKLLLATEIRGAKYYWHMLPPPENSDKVRQHFPQVYDSDFAQNYMVGNLGMLDAVCSTWFGTQSLYVHLINFMPVTAVTAELFSHRYVKEEFEHVIGPFLPDVEMAWRGFAICIQAIVDPMGAWIAAQDLVSGELDASLSKSQVLYWISTRGGAKFSAPTSPVLSPVAPEDDLTLDKKPNESNTCESHEGCASLDLTGACCPTTEGVNLRCCSQ